MRNIFKLAASSLIVCAAIDAWAGSPVVAVADSEALFVSKNPALHRNKQAAYHIVKDLLEANHWELTERWIAADYIQHNPQVVNGRQAVIDYFTKTLALKPTAIPARMKTQIVSVVAERDIVVVAYLLPIADATDSSKNYNTTTFDMWRFRDGKAVEHWDVHIKND